MTSRSGVEPKTDRQPPPEWMVLAPELRRETVLGVIRSARDRLLLSVFRCTDYLVLDELAEALRRRVRVEVLLTPRAKGAEQKRLKQLRLVLESMGAAVHRYPDPVVKYHAKYMVADDGPALVGSLNFTSKCFTNTCDFLLVTHDPGVVSGLQKLFESDSVSPESSLPEGLSDRLVVGPDRARTQITALLQQARRSIRIIDHKVADPSMVFLLKAQKGAGVEVQVLGGGQVGGLLSHGKMILVDESTAVIGSIALAPLNLDFRREVAIVIRDPACVSQLNGFFQDVAGGTPTRLTDPLPAANLSQDGTS